MHISQGGLLDFMRCEKLSRDLYRGESKDLNTGQVYGGQVLGQAINAASDTVDDSRLLRSAHAYFLRKGDVNEPIIYEVDRALDGGSVSSRVVIASQFGKQILHLSASFHKEEEGLDYQPSFNVPTDILKKGVENYQADQQYFQSDYLDVIKLSDQEITAPNSFQYWVKAKEPLPNQVDVQNSALAYISDMGLLHSALVPHDLHNQGGPDKRTVMMASIDHAIWFHRPFRADEWFFSDCRAVSNSNARGLSYGSLYDLQGNLFASTVQQGLLRTPRSK